MMYRVRLEIDVDPDARMEAWELALLLKRLVNEVDGAEIVRLHVVDGERDPER